MEKRLVQVVNFKKNPQKEGFFSGVYMKIIILYVLVVYLTSCGGGGTSSSSASDSEPTIIGLQGDLNAIEPIDLD